MLKIVGGSWIWESYGTLQWQADVYIPAVMQSILYIQEAVYSEYWIE